MVGPAVVLPQNGSTNFLLVALDLVVMSFVVYYCATIKKSAAFYVAIWSLVTSQFFMNLWHVLYQLSPFRNNGSLAALLWGVLGFYAVGLAIVGLTTAKCMPEKGKYHIGPRQMTSAVLFLAVFEMLDQMMRIVHFGRYNLMYYVVLLVVQLYCVSLLFIQSELFKKSALEKELFTMNMLMKQQEEQYEITRDNIDMINQKCHDLKHQVRALRGLADDESKERYLKELEQSVEIYGAIVKTGNDVLDTILTEKSLSCQAKGIKINCIADGSKLEFVDPVDLYGILGNAVDNAMEAVEKISDARMRLIDIAIFTRDRFLVINITNPMTGQVKLKNGLPVSTKPHNGYHGYGLRSIRHSLGRYDGTMSVNVSDHTFELKMLLPLP
ncbi:ATP-binding protein [Roseburia sp. AM51-8]|uniref:ATP-binding protein n=1 Tax=Roseburia sp. AM51-8 TaxID=2292366 RepID=UPI000E5428B9|nr:sensor histidine kinase [Roseburia sp. AM51-8]RHQ00264.1 ATP-binding protein [Roseburia sp. AM51-8]